LLHPLRFDEAVRDEERLLQRRGVVDPLDRHWQIKSN